MLFRIDKWVGAKGVSFEVGRYGFSVFPSLLARYRTRYLYKPNYLEEIFSIRKNLRLSVCDWNLDITILGLTFQFNKYQEWVIKNLK